MLHVSKVNILKEIREEKLKQLGSASGTLQCSIT